MNQNTAKISNEKNSPIQLEKVWQGKEQGEGDGATVIRLIDSENNVDIDPFLMFDYYKTRLPGGFPDHPHRGFETITYQLKGKIHHEDFKGHKGTIYPGGVQWMTAGKGIVHAEMPGSRTEDSIGFQLWINLSKDNKMVEPAYQEYANEVIPSYIDDEGGYTVKVISGEYNNVFGPCKSKTPAVYFDINLKSNVEISIPIGNEKNGYIFVYEGSININSKELEKDYAGRFKPKKNFSVLNVSSNNGGRFLVMAAKPLNEPIVQYGPFVMNTNSEIQQTFRDYQDEKNGFEGAQSWESEIKMLKYKDEL